MNGKGNGDAYLAHSPEEKENESVSIKCIAGEQREAVGNGLENQQQQQREAVRNGLENQQQQQREAVRNGLENQQLGSTKPSVILLGRGNSFSLGRSEVIVLHHRHRVAARKETRQSLSDSGKEQLLCGKEDRLGLSTSDPHQTHPLRTIQERHTRGVNLDAANQDYSSPRVPSPSPPPVSNTLLRPDLWCSSTNEHVNASQQVVNLVPSYHEDLLLLWGKAESIMAGSNGRVRNVLEEFGIGEPGGGGGGDENAWEMHDADERKREEDELWRIIEDNVHL